MLGVILQQRLLELGQLEEPVLLARRHAAHGTLAVGAHELAVLVLQQVGFSVIGFLVNAVPTLVSAFVQIAGVVKLLPELLHGARLTGVGSAHEVGVGDVEQVPCIAECGLHRIAPLLRGHAVSLGGFGDLLAVLVHSGDQGDVVAVHALIARDGIGGHRGVGGSQMRGRVHVVDGRGDRVHSLRHAIRSFFRRDACE